MTTSPGEVLRKFRRTADLTQRALGEALGVTDSAVSEWERGQSSPGRSYVVSADDALGAGGALLAAFGYVSQPQADETAEALRAEIQDLREQLTEVLEAMVELTGEMRRQRGDASTSPASTEQPRRRAAGQ